MVVMLVQEEVQRIITQEVEIATVTITQETENVIAIATEETEKDPVMTIRLVVFQALEEVEIADVTMINKEYHLERR